MKPRKTAFRFIAPLIVLSASALHAADGSWATLTAGNWSDTAQWTGGISASGPTSTATFGTDITAATTVTQDVANLQIGNLTFSDNGATGSAWTISGANSITLGDGSTTGASTLSALTGVTLGTPLTGLNSLTKTGSATAILTATNNSYAGGTTVNGGELQASVGAPAAGSFTTFGTGPITVNTGSTLRFKAGSTPNIYTYANALSLNAATLAFEDANHVLTGTVALTGANTINGVWDGKNLTLSGIISGGGSINKTTTSARNTTLVLSGANTYTGGTILTGGQINASHVSAFGPGAISVAGNGTLNSVGVIIPNNISIATGVTANFAGNGFNARWSGVISGDGTLQSSSYTALTGVNTYTGGTVVTGFLFGINSDAALGAVPASPVANNITLNGGTFSNYTGAYTNVTLHANRGIVLGVNGGNIDAGGDFIFNGVISGVGYLGRNTGGNVFLNGLNTYTGQTRATAGTTTFNTIKNLADTTGSSFGAPTTVANGTILVGGGTGAATITYTGTAATTDRVLNLNGTAGGATLTQSGTGLLKFTSPLTATGVGSKTLTLAGATAGTGEISGTIVNNGTTGTTTLNATFVLGATTVALNSVDGITVGATITGTGLAPGTTVTAVNPTAKSVTLSTPATAASSGGGSTYTIAGVQNLTAIRKTGSGTWTLSGANTYTGVTTIQGSTTVGAVAATSFLQVSSIGNGGVAGNLGQASSAASNIVLGQSGLDAGQLNYSGAGETTDRLFTINGHATLVNNGSGALVFSNPGAIVHATNANIPHVFTLGGTNTAANTLVSALTDGAAGTGAISLTKAGTGTWVIAGANTYSGATTVNGGTLAGSGSANSALTVNAAGTFSPGAGVGTWSATSVTFVSGATFKAELNSSTVTADKLVATGAVDLGGATLTVVDVGSSSFAGTTKLTLIDYTGGSLAGTFAGLDEGAIVLVGAKSFILKYADSSKVTLTAVGSAAYAAWADANAGGQVPTLDFDEDGVKNGVEYFMGETGSGPTANPSVVSGSVTWPKNPLTDATYVVEISTNLTSWAPAVTGVTDNGSSVVYTLPAGESKRFVRLSVTVP